MRKLNLLLTIAVFTTIQFSLSFAQWQPDMRLTNDPRISALVYNHSWAIKADSNIVHVVWYDSRDFDFEIYYKRSIDGGTSWGPDTRLTFSSGASELPTLAISGNFIHVIWWDRRNGNSEIYYKRSTDKGISWGSDIRLSFTSNVPANLAQASLSASGSFVHVAWQDNRNGPMDIYYKRSTDNGLSWESDVRLTNDPSGSYNVSIAVSGSIVHVVFEDNRDGNWEIYYKRSTDGGSTWGADTRLTNDFGSSELPCVSVSGSQVNVVWGDYRGGNQGIYYKRSTDNGISWENDRQITNNFANANWPNIASSGSFIHVGWDDYRDGNEEIYYKRSTDGGSNWGNDVRLTFNDTISTNVSVDVSGSAVHIVWFDYRDGNPEIYYKHDPTGNLITFTVSGHVTYRDNGLPVSNGIVKALHYNRVSASFTTVDSTTIQSDGSYTLPRVPHDTTYIMYYQNDEMLLQFVPTYYQSTIDWQQSQILYPSENLTNIDGQVYRITNSPGNNLHIGGICYYNNDNPVSPLNKVIIYAKIGDEFKNYGISNAKGTYTASMLPAGNYTLYAYRLGYNYITRTVTITNTNLDTINFYFGSPIGISNITSSVPSQFKLYQNYPNPFNPTTKIKFDIEQSKVKSETSNAKLIIYNSLGEEITTLINENLKPGTYEVDWNASNYPSGVYFYLLKAGDFTATKKLILLK